MIHFPKNMLPQNTKHFTAYVVSHKKQLTEKHFSFKQQYQKMSPQFAAPVTFLSILLKYYLPFLAGNRC